MVGGLLMYSSDSPSHTLRKIQHTGVTQKCEESPAMPWYLLAERTNYFNFHRVVRNCSAITAACVMIMRSVFAENLKVTFGDIDTRLRMRGKSYRIIYTPYAVLYHHECATRGKLHPAEDEAYMIRRWRDAFIKGDPCYNPNLDVMKPFRIRIK